MFTEIVSSKTATRTTSIDVSEVVLGALTQEEQPLRTIRARVAKELDIHESAATTRVARVLSNLVSQGQAERPRRGFYRLAVPAQRKPEPEIPRQLARSLAANPLQQRPKRTSEPQPTPVTTEEPTVSQGQPNVARLAEEVQQREAESKVEPTAPVALVEPAAPVAVVEAVAPVAPARPATNPEAVGAVAAAASEPASVQRTSRHARKVRARRERNWTSKGTMGAQGMILIILWFVASGVALFSLNNSYGIAIAIGTGVLLWLLNFAMKPRRRKRT